MTLAAEKAFAVEGIRVRDSSLAREITELVRDTESALRVYCWGALAGQRRSLNFDRELLYAGAMFHDMGLTPAHRSAHGRFEVDGANTARDFLRSHGVAQRDIDTVWTATALHTTPGIPQHMHPVIALVTAESRWICWGWPMPNTATLNVKRLSTRIGAPSTSRKTSLKRSTTASSTNPETTFGNVKADVLADKDPAFRRGNFCSVIRGSAWGA